MRKKNTGLDCSVVRLVLIHRQPVSSHMGSEMIPNPCFLPDKKTLRDVYRKVCIIIILFRQRLPPVRLLIDR